MAIARGVSSPRYEDSERYNAQRNQNNLLEIGAGVGLGVILLGALAHKGSLARPLSNIIDQAGKFRNTYIRALGEGLGEWIEHPANLSHGLNLLANGEFRQGTQRLKDSATQLGTSIGAAKARIHMTNQLRLHGMPSEFETMLAHRYSRVAQYQDKALGAARHGLISTMIDKRAALPAHAVMKTEYDAVKEALGFIANEKLGMMSNKDTWHNAMMSKLGARYNRNVSQDVWENVVEKAIAFSVPGRNLREARPSFITSTEIDKIRTLSGPRALRTPGGGRSRGKNLTPGSADANELEILMAKLKANRDYRKMESRGIKDIDKDFVESMRIHTKRDRQSLKMAGVRQATVGDLQRNKQLGKVLVPSRGGQFREIDIDDLLAARAVRDIDGPNKTPQYKAVLTERARAMRDMSAGKGLLIDRSGHIADLRSWTAGLDKVANFVAYETQIPFLKINPLQLMHWSSLEQTKILKNAIFANKGDISQILTGETQRSRAALTEDYYRVGTNLKNLKTGELLKDKKGQVMNVYPTSSSFGTIPNALVKMTDGLGEGRKPRPQGFFKNMIYNVQNFLDLGKQKDPTILGKMSSVLTKMWDPAWEGNSFFRVLEKMNKSGPMDYMSAITRVSTAMDRGSSPIGSEAWKAIQDLPSYRRLFAQGGAFQGLDFDVTSPESIMKTLGDLIQHRSTNPHSNFGNNLSPQYKDKLLGEWSRYTQDPFSFLNTIHPSSNKAALSALKETRVNRQTDIVKKLMQKEIMSTMEEMSPPGLKDDLLEAMSKSISSRTVGFGEADEARYTIASHIIDREMSVASRMGDTARAQHMSDLVNSGSPGADRLSNTLDLFRQDRYPLWSQGNFDIPDRQLMYNSRILWMNTYKRFPTEAGKAVLSDINSATKRKALGVGVKDWAKQFTAGRENIQDVTTGTFFPYYYLERLNSALSNFGIALSNESLGSAQDIAKNLFTRRFLPTYLALGAGGGMLGYLNWQMGEFAGGHDPKELGATAIKTTHLASAAVRDMLGITALSKGIERITPGSEMIFELPGMNFVDPSKSQEDLEEYYDSGYDAVRKGRYWPMGNTPYVGSKVEYWQPNWYKRATKDIMNTDVQYGSPSEHYSHTWFPTLQNPLNPITYLLDPYHYEKKHYKDRPYPVTGGVPLLEEMPVVGGLLSATVGQLIKPTMRMHQSELPAPYGTMSTEAVIANVNAEIQQAAADKSDVYGQVMPSGGVNLVQWEPDQGLKTPPFWQIRNAVSGLGQALASGVDSGGTGTGSAIYVGEGQGGSPMQGSYSIGGAGGGGGRTGTFYYGAGGGSGGTAVAGLNAQTKRYGDAAQGRMVSYRGDISVDGGQYVAPPGTVDPTAVGYNVAQAYRGLSDIGGMYGYMLTSLANVPYQEATILQKSSRMTSTSRAFWDIGLGGFGGDISEIGRRFMLKQSGMQEAYNPIDNEMPSWIPGPEYFMDFHRGDPYTKVSKGEMRLPGAGYEEMWDMKPEIKISPSSLGGTVEEMVQNITGIKAPEDDRGTSAMTMGDIIHKRYQQMWIARGITTQQDVEQEVLDKDSGISGYIDAMIQTPSGAQILDIKSMGSAKFNKAKEMAAPYLENVEQVNFYMKAAGVQSAGLLYVDRNDPSREMYFNFGYDESLYKYSMDKVDKAKEQVQGMIDKGEFNRLELYKTKDRFKILADVAPWSDDYRKYAAAVVNEPHLSTKEKEDISATKQRVAEQKKRHRFFPYQFKGTKLQSEGVTVLEKIDNNRFTTEQYGDQKVFSLAGVSVPSGTGNRLTAPATDLVESFISPGNKISISFDPYEGTRKDILESTKVVVFGEGLGSRGRNLNKSLIDQGLGTEDVKDVSPAGTVARFSKGEIAMGSLWERFAHMNTPLHTKFMQARSPLEDYERREVFGKNWQSWDNPIRDYVVPTSESLASWNPIGSIVGGALLGSMFGVTGRARLMLGASAAIALGTFSSSRALMEEITGDTWIPKRREKERDINEYFDILKYIKYRGLYEYARKEAKSFMGKDIETKLQSIERLGNYRKTRVKELTMKKRELIRDKGNDNKIEMDMLNQEINRLRSYKSLIKLNPWEVKAMEWKNEYEKTLYATDPKGSVQNWIAALPKKEREYASAWLKHAAPGERKRILEIIPENQRPFFQAKWGLPIDEKKTLPEFFEKHLLPDKDWEGWAPDKDLDEVKIKVVRNEGLDMSEFGFWSQDQARAAAHDAPALPIFDARTHGEALRRSIEETLKGLGLTSVQVNAVSSAKPGVDITFNYEQDRKGEFSQYANKSMLSMI